MVVSQQDKQEITAFGWGKQRAKQLRNELISLKRTFDTAPETNKSALIAYFASSLFAFKKPKSNYNPEAWHQKMKRTKKRREKQKSEKARTNGKATEAKVKNEETLSGENSTENNVDQQNQREKPVSEFKRSLQKLTEAPAQKNKQLLQSNLDKLISVTYRHGTKVTKAECTPGLTYPPNTNKHSYNLMLDKLAIERTSARKSTFKPRKRFGRKKQLRKKKLIV